MADTYKIPPDSLIWKYTGAQIISLYELIIKREADEINREYKMIRTALAKDAPDSFIVFENESKRKTDLSNIGVASDEDLKNHNPGLKVRG